MKVEQELTTQATSSVHTPVMLQEVVQGLVVDPDGIYLDATFGRGGHSQAILQRLSAQGRLICLDRDLEAIKVATSWQDSRVMVVHGVFSKLQQWVEELGYGQKVTGILLDLGVSSPQLDEAERGFSFLRAGPLDMRMDQSQHPSAAEWLASVAEEELRTVIYEYGEERFSRRIARAIVAERAAHPITTTDQLAQIVSAANPKWERNKHPATRTFQAIRMFINRELPELEQGLSQALEVLQLGGRLVVITFHSLEDRLVKSFIKRQRGQELPSWVPVLDQEIKRRVRLVGGVVRATPAEVKVNIRARSAQLRFIEKLI